MPAAKGTRPPNAGKGRKAGIPNKITKSAREAFQLAFDALNAFDGPHRLEKWAAENPTEFYKLYARLIPVEVTGEGGEAIQTIVRHVYESAITPPVTT